MDLKSLVKKYATAGPRYTSYPTAPQWTESVDESIYRKRLEEASRMPDRALSLYVHLPFCESLCYYCGCNIQIVRDHKRSHSYVDALLTELEVVGQTLSSRRPLDQIAWGGGTPTFLSLEETKKLFHAIRGNFPISEKAEISIEIDPRVTTGEHLDLLKALGFNRVSLGVQDFEPQVQKAINRVQPYQMTADFLARCRSLKFDGVNFDFIYGLPFQTLETFRRTVEQILELRPNRIALYNYAHLPSLRSHQRILDKYPMPSADERLDIFAMAYDRLLSSGYRAIGMDHFALAEDELSQALEQGYLYRNFQGYSVRRAQDMVGVGASAIGELDGAYFQNVREAKVYEQRISDTGMATFRGCLLQPDDVKRKWIIQQLMCRFELSFGEYERRFGESFPSLFVDELDRLEAFRPEGIVELSDEKIKVTELGRLFVRNIAMAFDAYLKLPKKAAYSQTL